MAKVSVKKLKGWTAEYQCLPGKPCLGCQSSPHFRNLSILAEAERITTQTRRDEYGHPFDNFSQIAKEWSLELGVEVTPEQVGRMMIRVKMVRLRHNPKHRDSLVDISGYANCLDLIRQRREEKP